MWIVLTGCVAEVWIDEPRVQGDADRTEVAVTVMNDGPLPIWVWSTPSRVAPPDEDGIAVMAYEVEGETPDVLCWQYFVPEATMVPPGGEADLLYETAGDVPYGEPELGCEDRAVEACAEALEVRVAWGRRPLDRRIPDDGDPRAIVAARQDGVVAGSWLRLE